MQSNTLRLLLAALLFAAAFAADVNTYLGTAGKTTIVDGASALVSFKNITTIATPSAATIGYLLVDDGILRRISSTESVTSSNTQTATIFATTKTSSFNQGYTTAGRVNVHPDVTYVASPYDVMAFYKTGVYDIDGFVKHIAGRSQIDETSALSSNYPSVASDIVAVATTISNMWVFQLTGTNMTANKLSKGTAATSTQFTFYNVDPSVPVKTCGYYLSASTERIWVAYKQTTGESIMGYFDFGSTSLQILTTGPFNEVVSADSMTCAFSGLATNAYVYTYTRDAATSTCKITHYTTNSLSITKTATLASGACTIKDGASPQVGNVTALAVNADASKLSWVEDGTLREYTTAAKSASTVSKSDNTKLYGNIQEIMVSKPRVYLAPSAKNPGFIVDDFGVRYSAMPGSPFDSIAAAGTSFANGGMLGTFRSLSAGSTAVFASDQDRILKFTYSTTLAVSVFAGDGSDGAIEGSGSRASIQPLAITSTDDSTVYVLDRRHVVVLVTASRTKIIAGTPNTPGMANGAPLTSQLVAQGSDIFADIATNKLYCCTQYSQGNLYMMRVDLVSFNADYIQLPQEIAAIGVSSAVMYSGKLYLAKAGTNFIYVVNPETMAYQKICGSLSTNTDGASKTCGFNSVNTLSARNNAVVVAQPSVIRTVTLALPTPVADVDVSVSYTNNTITVDYKVTPGADKYIVKLTSAAGCDGWKEVATTQLSVRFDELFPSTVYFLEIYTTNIMGTSTSAPKIIVKTASNE